MQDVKEIIGMGFFFLIVFFGYRLLRTPSQKRGTHHRTKGDAMKEVRVVLGLEDFKALVRGKIVDKKLPECHVKIALSDIGMTQITKEVVQAEHEWAMSKITHESDKR